MAKGRAETSHPEDEGRHTEFESLPCQLLTPFNWILLALIAFGGVSLIARFALGIGGSTHLSNTYAWGLWIVFDLVWIAVAAGAFATAGFIYVFLRKDLYSMGRSAVLLGLLSYSFVTVTLNADLGLPWHFYQLGLQAPEHSAMFEVSWCIALYLTILLIEFLPVPFQRWGLQKARSLLVYLAFRLGDMAVRGLFANAFSGSMGALFTTEIVLGGLVPLALLARASLRAHPRILFAGAFLTAMGVTFNRANVVHFAMHLKGPMPRRSDTSGNAKPRAA